MSWKKDKSKGPSFDDMIGNLAPSFNYSDVESRVSQAVRALEADRRKEQKMDAFREQFFSQYVDDGPQGSMTGRFSISQPNPQSLAGLPKWAFNVYSCPCGMCPDPKEQAETPLHPSALSYKHMIQLRARRAADEEWYARQAREELRRQEEMVANYRVKYRWPMPDEPTPTRYIW